MKKMLPGKIRLLKKYFKDESSVILAFVFGSFAKGFETEESDLDIAVYLKNDNPASVREAEDRIFWIVSETINKGVDLVCLNQAPASLVSNVFKTGIPLVIKDKKLYLELYLKASAEAEDFLEFLEDFRRIKLQSQSLSPEEKERLMIRIDFLEDEFKELNRFKTLSWEEYVNYRDKRKIVERWTENILNAIIDIAKIILSSEKKEMPGTYESALLHFGILLGLSEKEARRFARFAGLRNILAHEYLNINYEKIHCLIKDLPRFYKKFSRFLKDYLK